MKTNNKTVRDAVKRHILECVLDSNENKFTDFCDLQKYVKSEFERVANYPYNLKRYPNNQDRFSDYLCGLPFNFEFYTENIVLFLNSLGINPDNKTFSTDKSMKLYHYLIFREIFR